ncbi:MAG TPA: type II secretion system protein [Planctomycetes bacterium]|nr:type II secretion system protein [Planctomycetota bacterium]
MKLFHPKRPSPLHAGFTLAEVAVTLVIVGITLMLVMEGLNSSRTTSAQASNRKIAMQLALVTIGRVEAGLFWNELDGLPGTLYGSYSEEGYPEFSWELIIGDEEFPDVEQTYEDGDLFDSFEYRRQQRLSSSETSTDREPYADTGTTGGPYERAAVRVTFPKFGTAPNTLILERWIPLEQVFGQGDEDPSSQEQAP